MCTALGAGYFAKVTAKKALSDFGLTERGIARQRIRVLALCNLRL